MLAVSEQLIKATDFQAVQVISGFKKHIWSVSSDCACNDDYTLANSHSPLETRECRAMRSCCKGQMELESLAGEESEGDLKPCQTPQITADLA